MISKKQMTEPAEENVNEITNGRLIYIASPYAGDINSNIEFARFASRYCIEQGNTPIAAHLLYPQILDDNVPDQRKLGLRLGLHLLGICDEIWVCGNKVSSGMSAEIEMAGKLGIPIIKVPAQQIIHGLAEASVSRSNEHNPHTGNDAKGDLFIKKVCKFIEIVDLVLLDCSCNSTDNVYAKETLKSMHDILIDTYGTSSFDDESEFIMVPAVIQSQKNGHIGLGLVTLDLQSSGEHWGTIFLTPYGAIAQGNDKLPEKHVCYLRETYGSYDYWYTADIDNDIHADLDNRPDKISEFIDYCHAEQTVMKMV